MVEIYDKVSECVMKVTSTEEKVINVDRSRIELQKKNLLKNIKQIDSILAEMDKLGIKSVKSI